jgi:2'-5' RNA ligase
MKKTINILLKSKRLDILRKKYDSPYKKIKTHITLVYPFEVKNQEKLAEHIEHCLTGLTQFKITLRKAKKSGKQLVIDAVDNNELLMDFYKKLNSGILTGFENKELFIYLPHVTLGVFNSTEKMNEALAKLREQNLSYLVEVDAINLLTLNSDNSIKDIRSFKLPK